MVEAKACHGTYELGYGAVVNYTSFIRDPIVAEAIFEQLLAETEWEQRSVIIFGRARPQPRLVAYYATDIERGSYTYSGLLLTPKPFTPLLRQLKEAVEEETEETFDTVLLNYYRDGNDTVAWHSDNEKLYGDQPTIASLSFGSSRDFVMRSIKNNNEKIKFNLCAGDLLVMKGSTQQHWQHSVPRRAPADAAGPRINLTFRAQPSDLSWLKERGMRLAAAVQRRRITHPQCDAKRKGAPAKQTNDARRLREQVCVPKPQLPVPEHFVQEFKRRALLLVEAQKSHVPRQNLNRQLQLQLQAQVPRSLPVPSEAGPLAFQLAFLAPAQPTSLSPHSRPFVPKTLPADSPLHQCRATTSMQGQLLVPSKGQQQQQQQVPEPLQQDQSALTTEQPQHVLAQPVAQLPLAERQHTEENRLEAGHQDGVQAESEAPSCSPVGLVGGSCAARGERSERFDQGCAPAAAVALPQSPAAVPSTGAGSFKDIVLESEVGMESSTVPSTLVNR